MLKKPCGTHDIQDTNANERAEAGTKNETEFGSMRADRRRVVDISSLTPFGHSTYSAMLNVGPWTIMGLVGLLS